MKKTRLLCGILSICLVLMCSAIPAMALTFNDVEGDPTVSWAKDAILQMTDAGYIKGYEDGTYKPYRAISKLECLLLMGRILGAEEADYAEVSAAAKAQYGQVAAKYNGTYVTELSYLLYLGILTESDLASYASAANANTELFRHQAAVLMSKMLGRNTEAKAYVAEGETYADSGLIPASSKPYVEYVTEEGIMNGMDANEAGEPQFSPTTSLTRAQMAMLLSRMIDRLDKMVYRATIDTLDLANGVILMDKNGSGSERKINEDTVARKDGMEISLSALEEGSEVTALEIDGHIQVITVNGQGTTQPEEDGTLVYAKISQLATNASGKKITLADTEDSSNKATYTATENCAYSINGSKASFTDLKKNDFVKVIIKNGKIVSVAVSEKTETIQGTLEEVEFDEENHVYLTVEDQTYVVSNKGAKVERDDETVEYRELTAGDKMTLTLTYGKVTKVVATSSLEKFSGVLQEIIIAKTPSVTILVDGEEVNYRLRSNVKVKVSGTDATIYDLRPGVSVSGTLDGEEIKSINATTFVTNEKGEFTAEVLNINTNYKVITVV
ncbi:MAG: S-layer homology domain-containing protein, partial [Clostridia bacterium]|nr:S-layer homology domain-containing protein [Clostridia bacterium]